MSIYIYSGDMFLHCSCGCAVMSCAIGCEWNCSDESCCSCSCDHGRNKCCGSYGIAIGIPFVSGESISVGEGD